MVRRNKQKNVIPFIQLPYGMVNSRAYQTLSPSAAKALPFFLAKVKVHLNDPQRYLEVFILSYRELKISAKLADGTVAKVFRELVAVGFISPVQKGGLRGHGKSCSQYKLSKRWELYQMPGFVEIDLRSFGT